MPVGAFYASPDGTYPSGGWWYEDDGTVEGISDSRPELNLVKLLQP
jgi:putative alpha-1,2-mannosidase